MRQYYKKKRRQGSMAPVAEVLSKICDTLAIEQKVGEMAVLTLWTEQVKIAVGAYAAQSSKATHVSKRGKQSVLEVSVLSASLASELGLMLPSLLTALNSFSPQTGVYLNHVRLTVKQY